MGQSGIDMGRHARLGEVGQSIDSWGSVCREIKDLIGTLTLENVRGGEEIAVGVSGDE